MSSSAACSYSSATSFAVAASEGVQRSKRLRLAAADLIATYLRRRSHLILTRRTGASLSRVQLFPEDRPLALARLFTLPGSEVLRDQVVALGEASFQLVEARHEDVIDAAFKCQMAAIRDLEAAVRRLA